MKISRTSFQVLYDNKGNLIHNMPYRINPGDTGDGKYVWLPNDPFTLSMKISKGQESLWNKYIMWESEDGRSFPMFTGNIEQTLTNYSVIKGVTSPIEWIVRKHGRQFGICPARENS